MSRRVLLVDDEPDIREVARMSLEALAGWTVVEAADAAEALDSVRKDLPDLIVLDVMMPGCDGPTALARLRELGIGATPVVLMTAKAQPADLRRFTELGVAGVIAKPFDPMTLHQQLAAAAGWPA